MKIKKYLYWGALSIFAVLAACIYINSYDINQPQEDGTMAPRIKAGEVATFTLNGNVASVQDSEADSRLVIAMLAPRSWDVRNKATLTFRAGVAFDPFEDQTMSPIPETAPPSAKPGYTWSEALMERYGIGANKFNDMEWVAWWADTAVPYSNGLKTDYTVTIKVPVSEENLIAYLGFFVSHSARGFADDLNDNKHYDQTFTHEKFTVYGGPDETIDYTKTRFNMMDPTRSLQDDLITFTFAGESNVNDLVKQEEIYLDATAYTAEGGKYHVGKRDSETLMTRPNTFTRNYSVTIWPVGFFGIPEGETVTKIDYFFTNRDGSVVVNKSYDMTINGDTPESDDIPFTYYMKCGV